MIEVASCEYGDFNEKMSQQVDNGRLKWKPDKHDYDEKGIGKGREADPEQITFAPLPVEDIKNHYYKYKTSSWMQFQILLQRMLLQSWRDSVSITL